MFGFFFIFGVWIFFFLSEKLARSHDEEYNKPGDHYDTIAYFYVTITIQKSYYYC